MNLDDLKQKIKEIPISQVIGLYLPLTKKGPALLAVCPFHDDHKPSMHVNDQKNMFKCFVDDIGGDAILFVMKYKNFNFVEALKDISEKVGLNFDDYVQKKSVSKREQMAKKVINAAMLIYQRMATTSKGKKYFQEFLTSRSLNTDIANTYHLGFSDKSNPVTNYLLSIPDQDEMEAALKMALELSLIKKGKNAPFNYYDTFRHRILFPIWDHFGRPIGFTSRIIDPEHFPKYLNSSESFLFNKKTLLYGLHLAKKAIREHDFIIIVEGNMDQIILHNFGIKNTVAIMGVALGENSLNSILALTKNIYLALDNDNAGIKAMQRVNQQFMAKGLLPKYIDLAPHKDPDDFLQNEGIIKFKERIDEACAFLDFQLTSFFPSVIPELTDRKIEYLNKIFEVITPLGNTITATERVVYAANKLGLSTPSEQIIKNYSNYLDNKDLKVKKAASFRVPVPMPTAAMVSDEENIDPAYFENLDNNIEYLNGDEGQRVAPTAPVLNLKRSDTLFLKEVLLNPEGMESKEFSRILDFVHSNEVKRYISALRSILYEIDENEYPSMAVDLAETANFPRAIIELIGATLYNYAPKKMKEKNLSKLLSDLELRIKKIDLECIKDELKKRQLACTTEKENNLIINELFSVEKDIISLRKNAMSKGGQ